ISLSSMGADLGDINNDGYPELFVTDMLPDDDYRLKTTSTFENINIYDLKIRKGFYHQYMQNTLQLNNQNGRYQEIGHFAGVAASDWSWGALMWDADNDGFSDLFVCNGIYHDVTNQDFIDFFANEVIQDMVLTGEKQKIDSVINRMPSTPIPNKAFRNEGTLQFKDVSEEWGFAKATFSNGAAYGDLDNDGDLDLIINNVNQPALVYENHTTDNPNQHYLAVLLKGKESNSYGLGASIFLYIDNQVQYRYHVPMRGFQSSMTYRTHFGLGEQTQADSIVVVWADLSRTKVVQPGIDTLLVLKQQGDIIPRLPMTPKKMATVFQQQDYPFAKHEEDGFNDFYHERNIPLSLAQEGPAAAIGDVNQDGWQDIFVGGATGQAAQLYLGSADQYQKIQQAVFETDHYYEDVTAAFLDVDGDQDLDLYVGSGGNNGLTPQTFLQDRLYLNDGKGQFTLATEHLPNYFNNTSCVAVHDLEGDGDLDLFIGSRALRNNYGYAPESHLLLNDGQGHFTPATATGFPALAKMGMVTDALWVDVLGSTQKELLVVGEWMAPRVYALVDGQFAEQKTNLENYPGWWYEANAQDFDGDGDLDLFLGNVGENFYLQTDSLHPLKLWMYDFDKNGSPEKIISKTLNGRDVPVVMKKDLAEQIPTMKKKNVKHEVYAARAMKSLFAAKNLEQAEIKTVHYFKSVVALNEGNGQFQIQALP
ncbi:MAG: VCBS repeat-containing protein, partial [Bacteroidota bacterium]